MGRVHQPAQHVMEARSCGMFDTRLALARRGIDPLSHEDVGVQPGYSPYGIYERMDGVSGSDVCSA